MPLSFFYGEHLLKKEGYKIEELPSHLQNLEERMMSWANNYTVDLELTYKKLKDLERAQIFFPADSPIYFVEGNYRPEQLEFDDYLTLLAYPGSFSYRAGFSGSEYPDFSISHESPNPHIRGLKYYNPDIDNDKLHAINLRPVAPLSAATGPTGPEESLPLRTAFYDILHAHLEIPPYQEVLEKGVWASVDGKLQVGKLTAFMNSDVTLCYSDEHKETVRKVLRQVPQFANRINSIRVQAIIGTRGTIQDFIANRRTSSVFSMGSCGINTTAIGNVGGFADLSLKRILEILGSKITCSEVNLRYNNVAWKTNYAQWAEGITKFSANRKETTWNVNFLLDCEDPQTKLFTGFCKDMHALTRLPFDKPKYWHHEGYEGQRYAKVIETIARFYERSRQFTSELAESYKMSGNMPKERLGDYYDTEIKLFQKDDIKFNVIVKEEMLRLLPSFRYDKTTSHSLTGCLSFVRRDNETGLLNYLSFSRDPHWKGRVFLVGFQVNKYPCMDCAVVCGPWWRFSAESREFTDGLWWQYESDESLRETLGYAVRFTEDVGEQFYREIGKLMLHYFKSENKSISQSDSRGFFSPGLHTTRRAGPHRAVHKSYRALAGP